MVNIRENIREKSKQRKSVGWAAGDIKRVRAVTWVYVRIIGAPLVSKSIKI